MRAIFANQTGAAPVPLDDELETASLSRQELALSQVFIGGAQTKLTRQRARRQAWERMPELQFGDEVVRENGDRAQADLTLARWEVLAPDAQQRVMTQARALSERGKTAEAVQLLESAVVLHGQRPMLTLMLVDLLAEVPDFTRARNLAMALSTSSSRYVRAHALARLGNLFALEGRYHKAIGTLRQAIDEGAPYGVDFYLEVPGERLRQLAAVLGDAPVEAEATQRLRGYCEMNRATASLAWFDYRAAAQQQKCPALKSFLEQLSGRQDEQPGRRLVLREAASRGCVPCEQAVAAGMDIEAEYYDVSLLQLAACAEKVKQPELALRAYDAVWLDRWGPSPHHKVLSKFLRGKVLESLGRGDEAKASYRSFLEYWREADHPVPEAAEAKEALGRKSTAP